MTVQPSPTPVTPTYQTSAVALRPDAVISGTNGTLLGVELRWVESSASVRGHFTESYFEAASPAEPGSGSENHGESSVGADPATSPDGPVRSAEGAGRDGAPEPAAVQADDVNDGPASSTGNSATSRHGPGWSAETSEGSREQKERYEGEEEAAETTVDLFEDGLKDYLANQLADRLGERAFEIINEVWTPEHCQMLAALADKLDQLHSLIRNGIAKGVRIVVRWAGASDFTAALIGELVASSISAHFLYPLKGFAQLLRVTGTVCCTACGCAESCACARELTKDMFIRYLKWLFGLQLDHVPVSDSANRIIGPGLYFTYEYLRNTGPDGNTSAHWQHRADDWDFWGANWQWRSETWFRDFTQTAEEPSAAQPPDGPTADESPWARSSPANPNGGKPHFETHQTGMRADAPERYPAGNVSRLASNTQPDVAEPPLTAIFGHG